MKNYVSELIVRYFGQRHDPDTEAKIQRWLIDDTQSKLKDEALLYVWNHITDTADKSVYQSLRAVNLKIGVNGSTRRFRRVVLWRVAAGLIPLLAVAGVWFYRSSRIDVVEVTTLAAEQKEIRLPDGSTVWLNACSKITYPEKFGDTLRTVTLSGEAYFSVVHNDRKRFEVVTPEITVRVFGTQFNVKAYPDDKSVTTTLTNGKVMVQSAEERYTLRPNQELVYHRIDKRAVVQRVSDNSSQWRDGSLSFDELTIREIFKVLERKFAVEFSFSQTTMSEDKYSVKFTHHESLLQILNVLQDVTGESFTYSMNNKNILITLK